MPIILTISNSFIYLYTFIDSEDSTIIFIDFKFTVAYYFKIFKLSKLIIFNIIDSRAILFNSIIYYIKALIQILEY